MGPGLGILGSFESLLLQLRRPSTRPVPPISGQLLPGCLGGCGWVCAVRHCLAHAGSGLGGSGWSRARCAVPSLFWSVGGLCLCTDGRYLRTCKSSSGLRCCFCCRFRHSSDREEMAQGCRDKYRPRHVSAVRTLLGAMAALFPTASSDCHTG